MLPKFHLMAVKSNARIPNLLIDRYISVKPDNLEEKHINNLIYKSMDSRKKLIEKFSPLKDKFMEVEKKFKDFKGSKNFSDLNSQDAELNKEFEILLNSKEKILAKVVDGLEKVADILEKNEEALAMDADEFEKDEDGSEKHKHALSIYADGPEKYENEFEKDKDILEKDWDEPKKDNKNNGALEKKEVDGSKKNADRLENMLYLTQKALDR